MECHIKGELHNLTANGALFVRNSVKKYYPFLINVTLSVCKLLDNNVIGVYPRIARALLAQFTNINHSCPYTGVIWARDGYMDAGLLPFAAPAHNSYKAVLTVYEGYPLVSIGFVEFYVDIVESRNGFFTKSPKKGKN
uniref:Uncharacterized protein n=1 Tax=Stomoxys calcitrans TaxID=35570 RepID=A0A1I8PEL7_STOCA